MFHFRFHRSESFLFEENIENIKSKRDFRERSPFVKGTKNENYCEAKALGRLSVQEKLRNILYNGQNTLRKQQRSEHKNT